VVSSVELTVVSSASTTGSRVPSRASVTESMAYEILKEVIEFTQLVGSGGTNY